MIHSLFENLGVLAISALVLFLLGARRDAIQKRSTEGAVIGLVLGFAAFMAFQFPIPGPLGSTFDMRAAPLILSGMIGGPIGATLAGALGAAGRYTMGGGAVLGGMVSAMIYPLVGFVAASLWRRLRRDATGLLGWVVVGCLATIAVLPTFFIGQSVETGLTILSQRWPVLLGGNLAGVALLGLTVDQLRLTLKSQRETAELLKVNQLAKSAAGIGLWRYDFADDRLTWDAAQHALMRIPEGSFEGTFATFARMVHEEDWPALERTYATALATRSPYNARFRIRSPDGEIRHIRCSAVFLGPGSDPPEALIGVNMDETEDIRLQAELALKSAALDSAVCGVVIAAAEGDNPIVHVNRAFTEMTGYDPEEAVGRNCRFMHGGLGEQPALDAVRAAIRAGGSCEVTLRNNRRTGELFWNRLRLSSIRDAQGRVTHFIGVQEDVSREIADRERIEEARDHLEAILSAAPDAIIMIDAERRITMVNKEAERLFGWRTDEAVGMDIGMLAPSEGRERHDLLAAAYLADGSAPAGPMTGGRIIDARRKDGSVFPAHISLARHVRNGVAAATVIAHDMTAIVESRRALERMSEDLACQLKAAEAANEAKTQFLAVMSHELRTPLNGALGMAQLLSMTTLDSRQAEYVRQIDRCGLALLAIIEDLFEMIRLGGGEMEIDPATVDIDAVVHEALAAVSAAVAATPRLRLDYAPCDPAEAAPFVSDASRLRQVLINLLSNAVKFGETGVVTLRATREADGSASFHVSDEGPGIPAERHAFIFEPFAQLDQSMTRRHGGAGLGLAICKRIVAGLGGRIGVESAPAPGPPFTSRSRTSRRRANAPPLRHRRRRARAGWATRRWS